MHNHKESIMVDATLRKFDDNSIWVFTQLPIPLVCSNDYDHIYLEITIHMNNNYSLQVSNQEVFKAYYGYVNQSIQYQTVNQANYEIDLFDDQSVFKIVSGFWTIKHKINHS